MNRCVAMQCGLVGRRRRWLRRHDVLLDPPRFRAKGFSSTCRSSTSPPATRCRAATSSRSRAPPGRTCGSTTSSSPGTPGTHHINVFRVKTVVGLGGQPGDVVTSANGHGPCFVSSNWADWPLVANTPAGGTTIDWTLPDGVGQKFSGGELLMVQIHFVNATTQKTPEGGGAAPSTSTRRRARRRWRWAPSSRPTRTSASARATPTRPFETHCKTPLSGATIVAANGHFHSRGIKFTMNVTDALGNDMLPHPFYDVERLGRAADDARPRRADPRRGRLSWTCYFSPRRRARAAIRTTRAASRSAARSSRRSTATPSSTTIRRSQDYSCF